MHNTLFLAQLIGLSLTVLGVAMLAQQKATLAAIDGIIKSRPMVFMLGCLLLLGGVALILTHNVWNGSAVSVVVTLIGWCTVIKGALLLLLSPNHLAKFTKLVNYERNYYAFAVITLVIGVFLAYSGFWV